jgi:UDP-GlcNAc:undecaprenyl-phosphate GlcNAc-1-phosphate transferase
MGGVSIYAAFAATFFWLRGTTLADGGLIFACSTAMFTVGLLDDIVRLKPYAKLTAQIAIAATVTAFGLHLPWTPSVVVNQAITIFWLVGVTNAMNLLDNIDGLSAGIAVIAAGFMAYFFIASDQPAHAAAALGFAGACLGFLLYNFNPASIFMGDCGSLFVGFFIGSMALLHNTNRSRGLLAVLAPPVLILAIPILDTTLVTLSRKLHGRRVSQGGRDHASHRLVALGLSERSATLTLYSMAIASGFSGVIAFHFAAKVALGLLPVFLMGLLFIAVYLGRVRVYRTVDEQAVASGRALLPTLVDFTYKRRIFEVMNDFVIIVLAYYGSFLLRFDGDLALPMWNRFVMSLPIVIIAQVAAFLLTGLYSGLWRYTSIQDLRRFMIGTGLASLVSVAGVLAVFRGLQGFSRAVFIIDAILLFLGVAGTRISFRIIRDWLVERASEQRGRRVLIYGAGDGGELLLREIRNNDALGLVPVGFLDDDPMKVGKVIHGIRVIASSDRLEEVLPGLQVQEILISSAKVDEEKLATLATICRQRDVHCRRARFLLE